MRGLHVVVMGVSGCGKTTIGDLVARELGVPFLDGDSLHPVQNVAKLASGIPLTDEGRCPRLATVGSELAKAGAGGLVLACSALKRSHRDAIRAQAPYTVFLYLHGNKDVLGARLVAAPPFPADHPALDAGTSGKGQIRRRSGHRVPRRPGGQ